MDKFKVYVFPISGGEFPNQLALLSQVYYAILQNFDGSFPGSKVYAPSLCLGCSGGNIASYIGLAADWSPERIISVCKQIDPQMFAKNWWTGPLGFLPSALAGIFGGSLYRPGYGVTSLFENLFPTPEKIMEVEILTLAFNKTKEIATVFTNRGEDNSYFPPEYFTEQNNFLYEIDSMIYNDGDVDKIACSTEASYSIPFITNGKSIDGESYVDGGVSYASPFTPIHNLILDNYAPTPDRKLQITYFCSYDMNDPDIDRTSFYGKGVIAVSLQQMLHCSILNDRSFAFQIIRSVVENPVFEEGNKINTDQLAAILKRIENKSYALVLYPSGAEHINILKFTAADIIDTINKSSKNYNYAMWYEP